MQKTAILLPGNTEGKLASLAEQMPPAMLPVANRPVMIYAVELLARYGFTQIVVCTQQFSSGIEAYFGTGRRWNITLHYLYQSQTWSMAGAVKSAAPMLTNTFVVLPADILLDIDLDAALNAHQEHGGAATVVVQAAATETPHSQPAIWGNHDGHIVCDSGEEGETKKFWNTGAYIFEPVLAALIPARTPYDCHSQLLTTLSAKDMDLHYYELTGYSNPLQTFEMYQQAQDDFLHSLMARSASSEPLPLRFPHVSGHTLADGIWCGFNTLIHPSARLSPPVLIGDGCQIGRNVELGPNAVIGSHVIIDTGATIRHSTILDHSYVGQFLDIDQRIVCKDVLIDTPTGASLRITDHFLLTEASPAAVVEEVTTFLGRALALLLLVLALPVMAMITLLIAIHSSMPVFCQVPRLGTRAATIRRRQAHRTQEVYLYRFRTRNGDGSFVPWGAWLERWALHRLPELWNVVCGDLSLIGVKPLTSQEAAQAVEEWQQKRYDYAAGFTGPWYTQSNSCSDFDECCIADVYYVTTRTWREDMRQLWQTPAAWLNKGRVVRGATDNGTLAFCQKRTKLLESSSSILQKEN